MAKEDNEVMIARWLAGELPRSELEKVIPPEEIAQYEAMTREVDAWSLPPVDTEAGYEQLKHKRDEAPAGKVRRLFRPLMAVAAAIVLLVIGYFALGPRGQHEYMTAAAERKSLSLPDGTKVQLNAGTQLSWADDDWDRGRKVSLTGEAFFEVTKGNTFTVAVPQGEVRVLGTEFNVFSRAKYLEVVCYEGSVGVSLKGADSTRVLTPGMRLRYATDREARVDEVTGQGPVWVTDSAYSAFTRATLAEVLLAMEAQFGVTITVDTEVDADRSFSGRFVHTKVETALQMVTSPLSLRYRKTGEDTFEVY